MSVLTPKNAREEVRAGDWILHLAQKYEVARFTLHPDGRAEVATTSGITLLFATASEVSSLIYSRVEDRHSEIALDLRVKEAMLASQLHLHVNLGDFSPHAEQVQMELMYALMEVRRRMAARGQRSSKATQVEFEEQPSKGSSGVKPA